MSCCNSCLKDLVSCLVVGDELVLNIGGLLDGEDYLAVFKDNQGNAYVAPFTYNGTEKTATIVIGTEENQIPATLFNPHIGAITLEIHDPLGTCEPFNLYVQTKCVELEVVNWISGAYSKKDIGLEIPA